MKILKVQDFISEKNENYAYYQFRIRCCPEKR